LAAGRLERGVQGQQAAQVDKHMKGEASGLDLSEPIDEADEDA
jgi:hypothetical protein